MPFWLLHASWSSDGSLTLWLTQLNHGLRESIANESILWEQNQLKLMLVWGKNHNENMKELKYNNRGYQ